MRQRVALLRTYMFKEELFLLDEPFSALDAITKISLHSWYLDICKKFNLTTLLITHDIDEAIDLSDRIYIIKNKPGEIISEIKILHEVIGLHMNRAISCYREEQSGCLDMVVIQKQNEIEELSTNIENKIMNYIFEDDGNVSEVIGALDIIHHLDKIAHTTQSIYKWIMYRKYGNIN